MKKNNEANEFYRDLCERLNSIESECRKVIYKAVAQETDKMEVGLMQIERIFEDIEETVKFALKENQFCGHNELNKANLKIISTISEWSAYIDHCKHISAIKDVFFDSMNGLMCDKWDCYMMAGNRHDPYFIAYAVYNEGNRVLKSATKVDYCVKQEIRERG